METLARQAVDQVSDEFIEKVRDNTPEDTGLLEKSNVRTEVIRVWDTFQVEVTNKTPYWKYVEYWVKGNPYRYNKPKWNIFRVWVGARMYNIATFQLQGKLKTKITQWIRVK